MATKTAKSTKRKNSTKIVKPSVAKKEYFETTKSKWILCGVSTGAWVLVTVILLIVFADLISLAALLRRSPVTVNAYSNNTQVGVSYEQLGTIDRVKPVEGVHDEGLATGYPTYGRTLSMTTEQKNAMIAESAYLAASTTSHNSGTSYSPYYKMDANGYLYQQSGEPSLDKNGNPRQLYQHTASVGLYYGDVSDDEPGVIKRLTYRPRTYNSYYCVTGLYAPAGEVIKIQMSEADMNATGGLVFHIGQALFNAQANNIWSARNINRMPVILNTMYVNKQTATLDEKTGMYTAYIGSYLGGPIYVRGTGATYSVTISGGVNYSHYILGVTTEEEFNDYARSSAPYFDLEVYESGVLHSGPKYYAQNYDYEAISKAAVLWEKISIVSTNVVNQGVVFMYDCFVAAGAAVAFPGRRSVNCPASWMSASLNYDSFVTSGNWGNLHEYHHNFQTFGVGYTGEVTNNALSLVSYSLFTKISSARQLGSYGGAGLSGWNCYTSAPWALQRVNAGAITSTNGLAVYATLLHNFGQDAFIKTARSGNYFNNWANITHQNFSYYADLISPYAGTLTLADNDYPMFVPVSSVYQTGRSYMYDGEKRYIETMQPYRIPAEQPFTVDLNEYNFDGATYHGGSVSIARDFTYRIKSVDARNINGTFVKSSEGENIYTFTPNSELRSGKIYITLEIIDKNNVLGGAKVDDVDLVLEFEQTYEFNKGILQRTTYTYSEEQFAEYLDPTVAFENNYEGYLTTTGLVDNDNYMNGRLVQNANSEIWNLQDATNNTIMELSGKLYISQAGDYRIALRGRQKAALYLSFDEGETYQLCARIDSVGGDANFHLDDEAHFSDYGNLKEDTWIYFKAVLVVDYSRAFIGVGIGEIIPEQGIIDEDGNYILQSPASCNVTYANAYRSNYQFTKEFESDYFYTKSYSYNYTDTDMQALDTSEQTLEYCSSPDKMPNSVNYGIDNLFDGRADTSFLSNKADISENSPFTLTVKLANQITANHIVLNGFHQSWASVGALAMPLTFKLYGSLDGENFFEMFSIVDMEYSTRQVVLKFDNVYTFLYYKLDITRTDNGRFGMSSISFQYKTYDININGQRISPDDQRFTYKGDWTSKVISSNYGHINIGTNNSTMEFTFTGTRFAVLSSISTSNNYDVYIDGWRVDSFALKKDTGDWAVSYFSPELSEGEHRVVIRCRGETNIDSIVLF